MRSVRPLPFISTLLLAGIASLILQSTAGAASGTISASPMSVSSGGTAYVTWSATGVSRCDVYTSTPSNPTWRSWDEGLTGTNRPAGGITEATTFMLRCDGGVVQQSVTVQVSTTPAPAPVVTLTASPTTIAAGASTYVSWTTENVTSCKAYYALNGGARTFWTDRTTLTNARMGPLTANSTFDITCTGPGGSATKSVTVTVTETPPPPPPPTGPSITLTAEPQTINLGQSAYINFTSQNATSCNTYYALNGGARTFWTDRTALPYPARFPLTSNSTFDTTCTGPGGTASKSVTVTVNRPAPSVTLTAEPQTIQSGQSTYVSWTTQNVSSCNAYYTLPGASRTFWTDRTTLSNARFPLTGNATFDITCTGTDGTTVSKAATVTVTGTTPPPPPPPTGIVVPTPLPTFVPRFSDYYIVPAQSLVSYGASTTIKWKGNTTSCQVYAKEATSNQRFGGSWYEGISNDAVGKPAGVSTGPLSKSMIYTLRCNGREESSIVLVDQKVAAPSASACGVTEERLQQIRYYLDLTVVDLISSKGGYHNYASYPQAVYDIEYLTANALQAARNCEDLYMLNRLSELYAMTFAHLGTDRFGLVAWLDVDPSDPTGYTKLDHEQILASTQYIYVVGSLLEEIVHTDRGQWTAAMMDFFRTSRGVLMAHLDRWMNKKTMWIWNECGVPAGATWDFAYTFPDYMQRKYDRALNWAAGAPSYCNMYNDIDMWATASAVLLSAIDSYKPDWIRLTSSERSQLKSFAQLGTRLFESRLSWMRSSSPLCGGACDFGVLDRGGRRGHPDFPASLWPEANETMDLGHSVRLVPFIETVYGHREITGSSLTKQSVGNMFARAIAYAAFNRSFTDPAFTTFPTGINVVYTVSGHTYQPWSMSPYYMIGGYGFWARYDTTVGKINDAIVKLLDNKTPTTYMTPNGVPPGAEFDYLNFYSSLTHAPDAPVASARQLNLANVLTAIREWLASPWRK